MALTFRALDIETIADETSHTRGAPTLKLVAGAPRVQGEGRFTYEPLVEDVEAMPPAHGWRVVAISYVDVKFDPSHEPKYWYDKCYTECFWSTDDSAARADVLERRLLATFNAAMTGDSELGESMLHLVTWNGRTFDLPVILMRSLKHRLACGWYYKNRNMRYRYTDEGHCDLMDSLSDYGATRFMKLGDMARLVGLPGKTDMSGDKVSVLYAESRRDPSTAEALQAKTARYCLQDSIQTALLWLISRHLYGKAVPETVNSALRTFAESREICAAIDVNWDALML